ncbi:TIGR01777 family oxidoreductase [Marinoscillum sp. MHG1-6]|uniref:TIGR01777 family oxidoreductase n=1 Tax=Marinoscillum sp. MHG1-6 TaxID=2959627 RepID=UPI002157FCB6|nr:TIGR01777 family oxidoreductase [Marinoscillum sp. MHG1-6]
MGRILITGASGLVGKPLSWNLIRFGHHVVHLSRRKRPTSPFETFLWNPEEGFIDEKAFEGVNHIIHLAGAGVADKRWTTKRKKEILESRVGSTELLFDYVEKLDLKLRSYISASAIGLYGDTGDEWVDEDTPPGKDFLAQVVKDWEGAADMFSSRTRVAKVRIGIVLSENGGALTEIAKPVKLFVGAPLGNGKQYLSWIHIKDLVGIFQHILDENLEGPFNAVAPQPATNKELTQAIANALNKPLMMPNVPSFVMKSLLGEMASMVLSGSKVSAKKILSQGYEFQYAELQKAVNDLLV